MNTDTTSLLILNHLFPRGFKHLLDQGKSPTELLEEIPNWQKNRGWQEDLREVESKQINLISFKDPLYPQSLLQLPDFPPLLYVHGHLLQNDLDAIAIIGTRNASLYGKESSAKFAEQISHAGITVVSGLARGIDTAAHQGALKTGRTIAVLGSGISNLYPRENQKLAEQIARNGAIISEYPMKTPPFKSHFPKRNRIVSGISGALILIESPLQGGGMLTMNIGKKQGKPLFALPGKADMPSFEGNHFLIKNKNATLIDQPDEIFPIFGRQKKSYHKSPLSSLTIEEKNFLSLLPSEEKSMDELVLLTQLPAMKLNILLMRLVLKNAMKEFPGKLYKKIY